MATHDGKDESATKRSVRFVVTGFGPFRGVEENPTTILSNRLVDHLRQADEADVADGIKLSEMTKTMVIETSAKGASAELDALRHDLMKNDCHHPEDSTTTPTTYILLHLGVNYKGEKFQLEKHAYNDASFRIPDERGYQPMQTVILDDKEFGSVLQTRFDLESIKKELLSLVSDGESGGTSDDTDDLVYVSDDPGRFVCNYTYCCSMAKFDDENRFRSLFLHVPPFGVIDVEKQLEFVTNLMRALYETVV